MSYDDALLHHVQRMVMADMGLDWESVQLDEDGEIWFRNLEERPVCVRLLVEDGTTWARLFVEGARDLKRSAKLLREVNELNLSLVGGRALLAGSRLILAAEVPVESVEPGDLRRLVDVLSAHAERSGPMIQLVYGTPPADREDEGADR